MIKQSPIYFLRIRETSNRDISFSFNDHYCYETFDEVNNRMDSLVRKLKRNGYKRKYGGIYANDDGDTVEYSINTMRLVKEQQ